MSHHPTAEVTADHGVGGDCHERRAAGGSSSAPRARPLAWPSKAPCRARAREIAAVAGTSHDLATRATTPTPPPAAV